MRCSSEELDTLVASVRQESGPERLPVRQHSEQEARELLEEHAGSMTEEQARALCGLFNVDFARGQRVRTRFSPAFVGGHQNKLVADLELFNDVTRRIWRASDEEALATVDVVLRDPAAFPGSGRSYVTMLMYLRDPSRYAVWLNSTDRGLRAAVGAPKRSRGGGSEAYLAFCRDALAFAAERDIDAQLLDAFLATFGRGGLKRQVPRATPALPEGPRPGWGPEAPRTLEELATRTHLPVEQLEEWLELLAPGADKRQALFYGPPGTGKTFVATQLGRVLAGPDGEVHTVQFHPAYSYEDFVEGLRPSVDRGALSYEVRPGAFHLLCDRARAIAPADLVLVADEINRADLAAVMGELLYLLEYRGQAIQLPYSQVNLAVPDNLVLLGTMNTADRSLALVDFALRRRFHAIALEPNREVLASWLEAGGDDPELALALFDLVRDRVGAWETAPGHSYWMVDDVSAAGLWRVWRYDLRPYLAEYWAERGDAMTRLEIEVAELLGSA